MHMTRYPLLKSQPIVYHNVDGYSAIVLCHLFFPCDRVFLPFTSGVRESRNPPSSRADLAAWLMCLNLSAPRRVPPKYRVTTTKTLLTSCTTRQSQATARIAQKTISNHKYLQEMRQSAPCGRFAIIVIV
jgi:hypothetical protein